MAILSDVIIAIGLVFMLFGVVGVFRFRNFYQRILVSSKIDTVGLLTIIAGIIIKKGFSFFSFKIGLIAGILLILNPLSTHITARCAYRSGHKLDEENDFRDEKSEGSL